LQDMRATLKHREFFTRPSALEGVVTHDNHRKATPAGGKTGSVALPRFAENGNHSEALTGSAFREEREKDQKWSSRLRRPHFLC
jgi:hypothetical protein